MPWDRQLWDLLRWSSYSKEFWVESMCQSTWLESNSLRPTSLFIKVWMRSKVKLVFLLLRLSSLSMERNFPIFLDTKKSRIKLIQLKQENTFKRLSSTLWTRDPIRRRKSRRKNKKKMRLQSSQGNQSNQRRKKVSPKNQKMPELNNLFDIKNFTYF